MHDDLQMLLQFLFDSIILWMGFEIAFPGKNSVDTTLNSLYAEASKAVEFSLLFQPSFSFFPICFVFSFSI